MKPISSDKCNYILSLIDAGSTVRQIHSSTGISLGTISKLRSTHRSHLPTLPAGRPSKLSPANIRYGIRLISSEKAETAVDVTKALTIITNNTLSVQTVRRGLKEVSLKAVVKKK